jgi:LacI family transcriptional regulator
MTKNVTIKDVAQFAKVSIATVSRVINQHASVNPEIKEKVLKAIEELNYYPNNAARSLKIQNTRTIAFLVSDISDYFFTTIGKGIEDVIRNLKYNIMFCSTGNSGEIELEYLKLLLEKKVDGIILNTTGKNNEYISELSHRVPIVLSNRRINHPNFKGDFVDFDNFGGIFELTSHLISLGHRDIGVVNGPLFLSTFKERYEGFVSAMKTAGIEVSEQYPFQYIGNTYSSSQDGYEGAKFLMEADVRPTAIVLMNSEIAFGALRYFYEKQIKIPDDVSIVSFGDMFNRDLLYIRPTISYTNLKGIGKKLGELMIERIENNDIVNREIRFTPRIQYGNSTRPL